LRLTLGKTGSEQTRDLLDQSLGSQESVVLLGELLDELLVLVEPEREGKRRRKGDERLGQSSMASRRASRLTSSSPQRSCTRARSAWPGRRGQRRPRCRRTYEAWGRWGA